MPSATHNRMTYANVVATLALVFAISGSALDAGHYLITPTKQIGSKVTQEAQRLVIWQSGEPGSPIYLTRPYEGAPFALSIVMHVIAPFNLGTIITQAKIEIDP
jgi:hypothetical protein